MSWRLTVRCGPKVEKSSFPELEAALAALEARADELARAAPRRSVGGRVKRFEPSEQVFARLELAGPERVMASRRAGLDVRGDGSTEAYLGRVRRELIATAKGESASAALRRRLVP